MESFADFMRRREAAAQAYVTGDPQPLGDIVAQDGAATFFGPRGGQVSGAKEVWHRYETDASAFAPGGRTNFEILDMAAGDDVAYWVGLQRASVVMGDAAEPAPMDLRITEVFRRENGTWRMVHRHADTQTEPPTG